LAKKPASQQAFLFWVCLDRRTMKLRYLDFDLSEDTNGVVTFDAMATVDAVHWQTVLKEVSVVLAWCRCFDGVQGSVDDGADWDASLQLSEEAVTRLEWCDWDRNDKPSLSRQGAPRLRYNVSLTLCGTARFAQAFQESYGSLD
jgi:hypothetical protein